MIQRFLSGDELPLDTHASKSAPEIVIRQVGDIRFQLWDLNNARVMECRRSDGSGLLSCFDPSKLVYLFEPGASIKEPELQDFLIPTLYSCSPNDKRYKEFKKRGAIILYMPTWTLEELL